MEWNVTACTMNVDQNYQTVFHHGGWQSGEDTNLQKSYNNMYTLYNFQVTNTQAKDKAPRYLI